MNKLPRFVALIILLFVVAGLTVFSFGRIPAPMAPADNSAQSPSPVASTTAAGTSTASGSIQEGPISPEPLVHPNGSPTPVFGTPAQPQSTTEPISTPTSSPLTPTGTSSVERPASQSFSISASDEDASLKSITVAKGTSVTITFNVLSNGTYYGGLDFRSSVLNTGTIAPGSSKTVNFTAQNSFSFTPYWPASNIAKPYKITVTVN